MGKLGYTPVMEDMGDAENPNIKAIITNITSIYEWLVNAAKGHDITPPRMSYMRDSEKKPYMYGIIQNIIAISAFLTKALADAKSDLKPPIMSNMGNSRNPNMQALIANIHSLSDFIGKAAVLAGSD